MGEGEREADEETARDCFGRELHQHGRDQMSSSDGEEAVGRTTTSEEEEGVGSHLKPSP